MFLGLVDQGGKLFIREVGGFFALLFELIGSGVVFFEDFFNLIQVV